MSVDFSDVAWVLECGCDPQVEHCNQCDERREVLSLVQVERAVERACEAIYREFDGYWPSDGERARIAVALLAQYERPS